MDIVERVHNELLRRKKTLALAESCTGGALAARITAIPGASQFFLGSIVAYANAWKENLLGVSSITLKDKGAVSRETVEEMVLGLLERTEADYGIAISGIAGPGGATCDRPVGTVYIAIAQRGQKVDVERIEIPKSRLQIIEATVDAALILLWRRLCIN